MIDFQHDILPLKNIIFRTALRIVLNREEAEDIVQDILMRLWQERDRLGQVANLEAFALTAARNLALNRKAKMDNRAEPLDDHHDRPDHSQPATDQQIIDNEAQTFIARAINSLPEKQRLALHLRDIEGKTYKEIAAIMSITEADVKVSIHRARSVVKETIGNSLLRNG